jgi:hypothetical protein
MFKHIPSFFTDGRSLMWGIVICVIVGVFASE